MRVPLTVIGAAVPLGVAAFTTVGMALDIEELRDLRGLVRQSSPPSPPA